MHPRALSAGRYAGSFRETNKCVSYAKSPAVWIAGIKLKECKSIGHKHRPHRKDKHFNEHCVHCNNAEQRRSIMLGYSRPGFCSEPPGRLKIVHLSFLVNCDSTNFVQTISAGLCVNFFCCAAFGVHREKPVRIEWIYRSRC